MTIIHEDQREYHRCVVCNERGFAVVDGQVMCGAHATVPTVTTQDRVEVLTRRIAELEAALGALVSVCPEEGDLRIMMISLSGQAMTAANLKYVATYGSQLSAARRALEAK